jgi:hypothetical protein
VKSLELVSNHHTTHDSVTSHQSRPLYFRPFDLSMPSFCLHTRRRSLTEEAVRRLLPNNYRVPLKKPTTTYITHNATTNLAFPENVPRRQSSSTYLPPPFITLKHSLFNAPSSLIGSPWINIDALINLLIQAGLVYSHPNVEFARIARYQLDNTQVSWPLHGCRLACANSGLSFGRNVLHSAVGVKIAPPTNQRFRPSREHHDSLRIIHRQCNRSVVALISHRPLCS